MNTDQELLELAAKAAGLTNLTYCPAWKCMAEYDEHDGGGSISGKLIGTLSQEIVMHYN